MVMGEKQTNTDGGPLSKVMKLMSYIYATEPGSVIAQKEAIVSAATEFTANYSLVR